MRCATSKLANKETRGYMSWQILTPPRIREELAGDLHELFVARADAEGLQAARRWYRRQLVRAFLDFLVEVFAELESERSPAPASGIPRVPKPEWFGRAHGRQSTYVARGRKSA